LTRQSLYSRIRRYEKEAQEGSAGARRRNAATGSPAREGEVHTPRAFLSRRRNGDASHPSDRSDGADEKRHHSRGDHEGLGVIIQSSVIGMERREAAFSECETYRYRLDICWNASLPTLATICLNPSTATHLEDDPTVRRCKAFARKLGCGSYRMLNAFALRSTDCRALFRSNDPIGDENTLEFLRIWTRNAIAVAAWGAHIKQHRWKYYYRGDEIAEAIPELQCWKLTNAGAPQHPLYLPTSSTLRNLQ
jgi:hypothetical protein